MFDRVLGLPAHPLMVHAAVVLVPLLALVGIAYAVAPFTRPHIRWPLILLAFAAPGAVLAAKLSGDAFSKHELLSAPQMQAKIEQHEEFGDVLVWLVAGLGLASLMLAVSVGGRLAVARRGRGDALVPEGRNRDNILAAAGRSGGDALAAEGRNRDDTLVTDGRSPGDTPPAHRRGSGNTLVAPAGGTPPLVVQWVLIAAVVALSVASLFYVFKSGDSGAKMVWDGF